jgi:hypothetical protein
VGIVWQISMVAVPIYLVLRQWGRVGIWTAVFVALSLVLKFTWYDRLPKGDGYLDPNR